MLSQIQMLSIGAAVLLTSPAFARGPLAHAAAAEQVGDQRMLSTADRSTPVRMRRLPMSCGRIGSIKAARSLESINTPGFNTHGEEEMPCSFRSFGLHTFLSSRSSCL
jgi:hypothetical protein